MIDPDELFQNFHILAEKNMELKDLFEGNIYHICTDGNSCPVLMREDSDFIIAVNYLAICAWRTSVQVVAYCIMANHFHFLISSENRERTAAFIAMFKRMLSMYLQKKYGLTKVMKNVGNGISLIDDLRYLQNCVAYILRNPICARICGRVEDYPWSSYHCYFSDKGNNGFQKMISDLTARERRLFLKSDINLSACPFLVDSSGNVLPSSFVRADIVEKLFRRSGKSFLFALGVTNDSRMEYDLTVKPLIGSTDMDLVSEVDKVVSRYFPGKTLAELSRSDTCRIIKQVFYNNKTSIPQLSRVLGLPRDIIRKVLCT